MKLLSAIARRPHLWSTAAASLVLHARNRWWRRWPFLPVPGRDWARFRLECATAEPDGALGAADVLAWLEWCKGMRAR